MKQAATPELVSNLKVDEKRESPLDHVKALVEQADDFDVLLGNNEELEETLALLDPNQKALFITWQFERAAKRAEDPLRVIGLHSKKTDTGIQKINPEFSSAFIESLSRYGINSEAPSEAEIKRGIERAKRIVASGSAASQLAQEPFITEKDEKVVAAGATRTVVSFDGKAYINPALVSGCMGHDSWAGRGQLGQASVGIRELDLAQQLGKQNRSSIEQIEDYATRDTPLPGYNESVGGGLSLIITDQGPIFFAGNAHRTSAAKLRGEPLSFNTLTIYDARKI